MIESAKTRLFWICNNGSIIDGIAERKRIKHEAIKEYTCYFNITDAIVSLCNCSNATEYPQIIHRTQIKIEGINFCIWWLSSLVT